MKYLLLGTFSLIATLSFGQIKKFTFKLGQEYELPRKTEDLAFFGNNTDGIVNLSMKKDELNVLRFDPATLVQTTDKQVELTDATRNFNSEMVVDFGTNYYWLHSDWDKSAETETLYYDKVDAVAGKIVESNKVLITSTKIAGTMSATGFYSFKTVDKYNYNFDVDHKHLLITYRLWPEERKEKNNYDKIGFFVFDEHLKKIWGGEFTMPYNGAIMDNEDFAVDSQGNAYLLAKVYDSEKRKERDKETGLPGYNYEVMKFTRESKKIVTASISLDDNFVKEGNLIESAKHEMLIACTYSKKSKGNGTDGIFLATLDQAGKISKYKGGFYQFPLEELTKFESARMKRKMEKKDDYEAPNIKVRDVIVSDDGSVFIACEEFHVLITVTNNQRGIYQTPLGGGTPYQVASTSTSNQTYTFFYGDILAAKINAAGQFEWLRKIPKTQRSNEKSTYNKWIPYRGTMGFKLINDTSGYYFLYLDNKKNVDLAEDEAPKYHLDGMGGQVMVTRIDPAGKVTKDLLFDTREEDVMLFPADFSQINTNQFIGRAKLKKNHFEPLLITVN